MCTVDLEDAYFLVPVHKITRKYLRFEFSGKLFQFTCLLFGLNLSPFIYTKLLKPVANYVRSRGLSSVICLDDILCIGNDYESSKKNVDDTIELLKWLGFLVNMKKSKIIPSTRYKFLGLIIDSKQYSIELPDEKRTNLEGYLRSFLIKKSCSIKDFAKLIGKLIAACPAVEYGLMHTGCLEREKTLALMSNN